VRLPLGRDRGLLAAGAALAAATLARPFPFVPDDSLFYVVIGRNVAAGDGITFNRVMPTNGFQPLWQAIVAAVVAVCDLVGVRSDAGQLRAVLVVCWLLLALGVVLVMRLVDAGPGATAAGAVVLAILGGPYGTMATEANLVLVLVALSFVVARPLLVDGTGPVPLRRRVGLGVVLGLLMLARLDAVFLVVAFGAGLLVRGRTRRGWRGAIAAVAPVPAVTAAVVAPYLVWNQVRFGHLNPISGAIKLDTSQLWFSFQSVGASGWGFVVVAATAGAAGVVGDAPERRRRPVVWAWAVVTAGALAANLWYLLVSPGALTRGGWYHAPHVVALALGGGLAVERLGARWSIATKALPLASAALLVVTLVYVGVDRLRGANQDQAVAVRSFVDRMRAELPADAVVLAVDYPGYLALSGRSVVAVDGLTGDFEFQAALRDVGVGCTAARLGVDHVVTKAGGALDPVDDGAGVRVRVDSWLYRVPAGTLDLRQRDRLLTDDETGLTLWRVRPEC